MQQHNKFPLLIRQVNIYTGTITNPTFRDIYAPVDGFVVNGGLKLNL
ncbi:MAG TPA: hypothetical protein VIO43_09315 [Lutibacter sp.]